MSDERCARVTPRARYGRARESAVEILFTDEKARRSFSDQRELRRRWGAVGAKRITLRLQQMAAAPTLDDMRHLPGRCHALSGDRAGCFAVDVHQPHRLIFESTTTADTEANPAEWSAIESVTILEVVDYH
jgi:proteic killer suppression protein